MDFVCDGILDANHGFLRSRNLKTVVKLALSGSDMTDVTFVTTTHRDKTNPHERTLRLREGYKHSDRSEMPQIWHMSMRTYQSTASVVGVI